MIQRLTFAVILSVLLAAFADAATYRVVPSETNVLAGSMTNLAVEVETESGDNVVGFGYFSFAIDMTLSGSAGAAGDHVSGVLINEVDFDDLLSNSVGVPFGNQYLGIAGATTDVTPPNFGSEVGDVTRLFNFNLLIPPAAEYGDTITIVPSEGTLENLIVNETFDNVAPQTYQPAMLTVVPEPTSAVMLFVAASLAVSVFPKRRNRSVTP